jgi:transposase
MGEDNAFAGMDVHKATISVAVMKSGVGGFVEWRTANRTAELRKLGRRLVREGGVGVRAYYEAGPCGYRVQRVLGEMGVDCVVVAPSMTPVKPGERVKTDRRDARKLAKLLKDGELTEVHPPTSEEEAVREVCRAREDAQEDLLRCRHRLTKMLLRRGIVYPGKHSWGQAHRQWLRGVELDEPAERVVFADYLLGIEQLEERVESLTVAMAECAEQEPYRRAVGWLRCFRGIDTVTAMTIVAELHGFERFRTARELMAYLGLTVSESSSGERVQRGGLTKTGNAHVRRVLVECAWHYSSGPSIGVTLRRRRKGQPGWVIAVADRAQQRLHRRYWHLVLGSKKLPQKAVTAVARELVGFIWAVLSKTASPQWTAA